MKDHLKNIQLELWFAMHEKYTKIEHMLQKQVTFYVKLNWRQISCPLIPFHWYIRHILALGIDCVTGNWSWDFAYFNGVNVCLSTFHNEEVSYYPNSSCAYSESSNIFAYILTNHCLQCLHFEITNWSLSSVIFFTITLNKITLYR